MSAAESTSLPLEDVRRVFRIVAECRERGDDWRSWRECLLTRAVELLGARVGLSDEVPVVPWEEYPGPPRVQYGWDSEEEAQRCHEYWAESGSELTLRASLALGPLATFTREPFIDDDEWYSLPEVQEVLQTSNVDAPILSRRLCGELPGWGDGLVIFYPWGGRQPDERDRQVLSLLHDEIAALIGGPLAARGEPAPSDLSPRKQQVLECMLMGATDQHIADALGLSRPTASEHAGAILRHFEVKTRAELLASFLQRHRPPRDN